MSSFQPDSDDDDDDMFIMGGGSSAAVSIYSRAPITINDDDDNDDDDDDDDDVVEIIAEQKKKKRSRRARLNYDLRPKSREVVNVDDEPDSAPAKPSVFSSVDDNAVCVIPDDDPIVSVADDTQYRAQLAIANARKLLGSKGDEEQIERDAELYARRVAAENARREEDIKAIEAVVNARAAPPSAPSQIAVPSTSAVTGTVPAGTSGEPITLRVRAGKNSVKMKILTTDPLRKMLQPFCVRFNIDENKAVMEVDGEEVEEGDTPVTYDLENNNIVDVRVRK